ncbi:TolC family protein [Candidatus Cetobacterium colombiensis]|uniref:TolC family protein n=1 Tax=Candidatus Cetobacterium colombiensis TaxID=3073100 RepID=A0ABU4WDB3_9FUSO|nr:TolC family protein [Candidatus Cetobacterium colombiensis]MDX8337145.1 TolC family protein [Candidatus Cetobacterium colombiensis]
MRRYNLIASFLVLSLGAYSQGLGLEEILKRVETGNPEVKVKELDVMIKEKGKKKAFRNLILPPITMESENDWETAKKEGFGFEKIEAVIPIFQGGKIMNTYKRSKSELELAKEEKKLAVYSWQETAVNAYFTNLNYRKQKEITDSTIDALQKQHNRLNGLYEENKLIAKSEILKVEANLENNKALNYENSQKERAAKETLMQLLGYDLDRQVNLDEFNTTNYLKSLGAIKKVEDPKNTTLGKAQSLMVELAEYDLKIAKADLYPTLYVKPSHTFKEENLNTNKYETVNEGRVEVGIRYTFAWGATLDSVDQSEYQLDQAKIKYDNNISGIKLDMRNKLGEIESLAGQSEAQKKRVELLRENLKIDNLRYDSELVTTFDYLNSVNQLKSAEEDYYKLQRSLVLAVIEYENLYK